MTPIKIPGKKLPKRHREPSPSGRRLKLRSKTFSSASRLSLIDADRTTTTKPKVRGPSCLERLPTELLEIIFFQCLNLNLPLASPLLSAALSSFHVKSRLLFKAFESGPYGGLLHSEELLSILHSYSCVTELQRRILALNWMTLEFLHQCIPIYLEKTLLHAFKTLQLPWMDGTPANNLTRAMVVNLVKEAFDKSKFDDRLYRESLYVFDSGPYTIQLKLDLSDGAVSLLENGSKTIIPFGRFTFQHWELLYCLERCSIPEKAFRGAWTAQKCEFLNILIRSEAELDWIDSTSGELVEQSFLDALRNQNCQAVELLMHQRWKTRSGKGHLGPDFVHSSVAKAPRKCCRRNYTSNGVGFFATLEHLRTAAIQYDCPKAILEWIQSTINPTRLCGDKLLTSWALQKRIEGDERGPWLLSVLETCGKSSARILSRGLLKE